MVDLTIEKYLHEVAWTQRILFSYLGTNFWVQIALTRQADRAHVVPRYKVQRFGESHEGEVKVDEEFVKLKMRQRLTRKCKISMLSLLDG